jgi:HemY protein
VSERWLPVSPVTGRLDAFKWKLPVAEIGIERAPIEADPVPQQRKIEAPPDPLPTPGPTKVTRRNAKSRPALVTDEVIPLVHAPDDPGPGHVQEGDPVPEPTSAAPKTWDKFLQLFR